jgi:hypothetical protein
MNNYLITIFFLMKSITIKGSERSVGKVATKALRWIGSLAYYTEEIRQFISQQKLWLSKTWFTLKRSHS